MSFKQVFSKKSGAENLQLQTSGTTYIPPQSIDVRMPNLFRYENGPEKIYGTPYDVRKFKRERDIFYLITLILYFITSIIICWIRFH